MPRVRRATHAGSWYSSLGDQLRQQLEEWLEEAEAVQGQHARAIIAPHAGYRYSGYVAAYSYNQIDPSQVRRVFLLGPSHHFYSKHCLLSPAEEYGTPLGPIRLDADVIGELRATGSFKELSPSADEAEHSLELHLPYLAHVLRGQEWSLVPVVVGALSTESEAAYGALLAPYLSDPSNLFVVSSDFCHWGSRFNYTHYDLQQGPIHASIEALDRRGMQLIEAQDAPGFAAYLRATGNTICGRHPTAVLLHALAAYHAAQPPAPRLRLRFTKYAQSQACTTPADSSVSYAAAVVLPEGSER
ncbi:cell motility mediator [Micractinium conductrix]|uniref:Cell motility mediator n=1 Tax=Micractinium conductrix TaxID=554055 RepID=A0A2P6VDR0_9CHLO|nr:cell motility mediator [Micractinium conductrix]|eukprot:PSC72228.1 cell motility mediator [Micractinium conductrix]